MNQLIRIGKVLVLLVLAVAIYLIWRRFYDPRAILAVAFLIVWAFLWGALALAFVTCYFEKLMIQQRITKAGRVLEEIATVTIKSYKPRGNYATLRFCSEGVPAELWEEYRNAVQSALNYTILGRIEHDQRDWRFIVFKARRGRPKVSREVLDDADL